MPVSNTNFPTEELNLMFTKAEKIFFIGIGGISMSGIAQMCIALGKKVYGYDKERSATTVALEKIGKIRYYSTPDNISGMDMVVYTNAIDDRCHEYRQAKRKGIPLVSRANLLGYLISLHRNKIGICGMHGKSTTTAMLGHIFVEAGENPTIFCGAKMGNYNTNFRFGGRECCIFEACEYQNSFHSLPTTDAGVLNIDYDHPDFFSSIDEIQASFQHFANGAKRIFINADNEHVRHLCHPSIVTFGFDKRAQYRAVAKESPYEFDVYRDGSFLVSCTLPVAGEHHISDALCAFAIAHRHGIGASLIANALSTFVPSGRRMEFIKKSDTGADIFEDYAHHPTEIRATVSSLLQMGYTRILCVFQSHTYSRTYYLYREFCSAFASVSQLIVYPVFSAREENIFELTEEKFATDCGGEFLGDIDKIVHRVKETDCDCVVLMGAGDLPGKIKGKL